MAILCREMLRCRWVEMASGARISARAPKSRNGIPRTSSGKLGTALQLLDGSRSARSGEPWVELSLNRGAAMISRGYWWKEGVGVIHVSMTNLEFARAIPGAIGGYHT